MIKPNSVLRNVAVVKAAVNHVITEHSLSIPNVFNGLRIKGAGAEFRGSPLCSYLWSSLGPTAKKCTKDNQVR